MNQSEFVNAVTRQIAAVLACEFKASYLTHNFTNNLLKQVDVIQNANPHLDIFQVLAVMFSQDVEDPIFALAFKELQGPGKELLGINFQYVPEAKTPKVTSLMIGPTM